jgi:xylulokinase
LFYVGVDIGTSSIKFIVLNEKLNITETIQREVDLSINKDNIVQYNPAQVYELVRKELERLFSKYRHIRVGLSCHSPSLVIMDKDGNPLETIIWLDKRAEREVSDLLALINERELYYKTGLRASPLFFPAKILWVKKNKPWILDKAKWIVQLKDYVFYKLTGEPYTDYSMASETQLFNISKKDYDDELLEILNISRDQLFNLEPSIVAYKSKEIQNTEIALGGVDSVVAATGAGVVEESFASIVAGSSACIDIPTPSPILNYESGFETYFHAIPNKYVLEACLPTAGLAVDKIRELLGTQPSECLDEESVAPATDLLILPFLMGIRSPDWKPDVKGLIYGIDLSTRRSDFLRAVYEGVAYWIREELEIAEKLGLNIREIIASGGMTHSTLFSKLLALITKRNVRLATTPEVTGLGAALIAGVSSGLINWSEIPRIAWSSIVYEPGEESAYYEDRYRLYIRLKKFLIELSRGSR